VIIQIPWYLKEPRLEQGVAEEPAEQVPAEQGPAEQVPAEQVPSRAPSRGTSR
jgi:hypothetical protein